MLLKVVVTGKKKISTGGSLAWDADAQRYSFFWKVGLGMRSQQTANQGVKIEGKGSPINYRHEGLRISTLKESDGAAESVREQHPRKGVGSAKLTLPAYTGQFLKIRHAKCQLARLLFDLRHNLRCCFGTRSLLQCEDESLRHLGAWMP